MSEAAIQTAIVNHFRRNYAGHIAHCPSGGRRGKLEAVQFKRMGVQPGVPDLLIWSPKGHYLVEVKTSTGAVSPAQTAFISGLQDLGFDVAIVRSADEAAAAFRAWGLPRKEARARSDAELQTGF